MKKINKARKNFLLITACSIGSLFFFGLAIYGYITNTFQGSDEDLRTGFILGGILSGSNALAIWLQSRHIILVALLAPLWGAFIVSSLPVTQGAVTNLGGIGDVVNLIAWHWIMLILVPLVVIFDFKFNFNLILTTAPTFLLIVTLLFLFLGIYIYGYVYMLRSLFVSEVHKTRQRTK